MLAHYCRHFPLVELNFSFYRLPTGAMLAHLADQTPEGFQFIVKMPRSLSHKENAADLVPFREAVDELQRRGRLLGLLCQLPQATHDSPGHRAWLEKLAEAFVGRRLAIEFRHRSWFRPEVPVWLGERQLDLVSVDAPDLPNLYPRGLGQSGPRIYVRFHSRSAEKWYRSDKQRYDYHYDDRALGEWVDALSSRIQTSQRTLLLFNNCQRGQAAANALRMRELLAQLGPETEVIQPFAATHPETQQRSLFD
jgi:uncharacterized protein YecE (DUF72 family)